MCDETPVFTFGGNQPVNKPSEMIERKVPPAQTSLFGGQAVERLPVTGLGLFGSAPQPDALERKVPPAQTSLFGGQATLFGGTQTNLFDDQVAERAKERLPVTGLLFGGAPRPDARADAYAILTMMRRLDGLVTTYNSNWARRSGVEPTIEAFVAEIRRIEKTALEAVVGDFSV